MRPGNRVGVLSDQEVGPAGGRVNLDQRTQRRLDVDAVAVELVPVGVLLAHVQIGAVHAVATGVIRGEAVDPLPGGVVERVVGGAHVGEAGIAALVRDDLRREHCAHRLDGHVGAVVVPSLVAAQGLGEVVLSRTERAIALDVRQRGRRELEVAEATGELVLLVLRHVLAGEHEQRVLEPQLGQLGDGRIARAREDDIADDRPERRVQRLDLDRPHGVAHAAIVRGRDCGSRLAERRQDSRRSGPRRTDNDVSLRDVCRVA